MLHLLQHYQNDFTFSPSLYSVALCDNIGLVLLILRLAMLFCYSSYCTMCIIHPDLVSFTFYTIPISPLCNLKNFSFTCNYRSTVKPLITDPPRSGQSLYNGQTLWHGLNLPYLSYIMNLRGVDNLPILYNGRSYGPERTSACKFCSKLVKC